jgi:hypothetical protein
MLAAMTLLALTLAQDPPPRTLTPEDIYKSKVVEKYGGQRVRFKGWLNDIHRNEKRKLYIYEVKATYTDPQAPRKQSATREVSAPVCFARDLVGLRSQFQRAKRNGERLIVLVEGTVVKYPLGWQLENAKLISSRTSSRGR